MLRSKIPVSSARVLVMGLTFKENCPDLRNTKVVDVVGELRDFGMAEDVHDPWADEHEAEEEHGLSLTREPVPGSYDAIVLAVAHREFQQMGFDTICAPGKPQAVIYDLKHILPASDAIVRL